MSEDHNNAEIVQSNDCEEPKTTHIRYCIWIFPKSALFDGIGGRQLSSCFEQFLLERCSNLTCSGHHAAWDPSNPLLNALAALLFQRWRHHLVPLWCLDCRSLVSANPAVSQYEFGNYKSCSSSRWLNTRNYGVHIYMFYMSLWAAFWLWHHQTVGINWEKIKDFPSVAFSLHALNNSYLLLGCSILGIQYRSLVHFYSLGTVCITSNWVYLNGRLKLRNSKCYRASPTEMNSYQDLFSVDLSIGHDHIVDVGWVSIDVREDVGSSSGHHSYIVCWRNATECVCLSCSSLQSRMSVNIKMMHRL